MSSIRNILEVALISKFLALVLNLTAHKFSVLGNFTDLVHSTVGNFTNPLLSTIGNFTNLVLGTIGNFTNILLSYLLCRLVISMRRIRVGGKWNDLYNSS